ncbi:unnamed protein product [Rotaria socialis]|uniref:DDE Tnp4 domain-containing protein n=1 Tax=Rotaria socialis TaxID=392032 RepID=A0A820Y861_9BILA|nr:unnamed protein product [Rotaria socialis]
MPQNIYVDSYTLKSLSNDQNVCNACRHLYIKWKNENSELSSILDHFKNDMYELMNVQVQTDDSPRLTTEENPTLITTTNQQVVKLQLNEASSFHTKCCVCVENLRDHAAKITSQNRDFIFFSRNIWIPEGARCCSGHLINQLLLKEAVDQIKPFSIRYQELSSSDVQLLLNKAQNFVENGKKIFSFDDPRDLNDDEYRLLTRVSRDNFNDFVQITSSSTIRPSCSRSIRTAVGIYLCKLRLAIVKSFVSDNLGFGYVTHQYVIGRHTTAIARELMCGGDSTDTTIIIIDRTHLHIQKSRNNKFERKTFNLCYVVACIGSFMFNFNNNDAGITKDILLRNTSNILSWLKEHDILAVDRGFRDSICVMEALGLEATIPSFLDGRRQFSAEEANESRCITKIRWVVEVANRCLKQFKYFANTIQNSSLVYLESDVNCLRSHQSLSTTYDKI